MCDKKLKAKLFPQQKKKKKKKKKKKLEVRLLPKVEIKRKN